QAAVGPGEGLQRDAVVGEARAAAAVLLGNQHAHEALLAEHAQLFGGPSRLPVARRRGGFDDVAGDAQRGLADHPVVFGKELEARTGFDAGGGSGDAHGGVSWRRPAWTVPT